MHRGLVKLEEENLMPPVLRGPVKVIAGNAHPALAGNLARELKVSLVCAEVGAFADDEIRVHVSQDVRDAAVFIVQPTCPPVNDHLMVLALLADAVRAAGAARVTGIVPYFGYARQEQRGHPGDARSAQVVGRLLGDVGLDHLVTLDLHAPALESALPMPATLLHAEEVFLPQVKSWAIRDLVVVAPDAGGLKRAQRYALALDAPLAVIVKARPRPDVAAPLQVLGEVEGRVCLVVDDMASTGRTLAGAAEALRQAGARDIHAVFTHAVLAPGAVDRLLSAQFGKALTTDSIAVLADSWLEVIPVAPLLARTVRYLCGDSEGVSFGMNLGSTARARGIS
jgi:ribose-phosphate pyrophosphokinase